MGNRTKKALDKMRATKVPAWKEEPLYERLFNCMAMLYVKGMITEAEKDRIRKRLHKLIEQEPTQ